MKRLKFEGTDVSRKYVLDIPFMMYYQIMTARTNGLYVLPFSGKIVDMSDGTKGWDT